ncbi:MAG: hypothetical protein V1793_14100 [Pseudomonadota bacterium]
MNRHPEENILSGVPMKTGEILVQEGLINPPDIDRVLAIQSRTQNSAAGGPIRLFGRILCDLNLVSPLDIYFYLNRHGKLLDFKTLLMLKKDRDPTRVTMAADQARSMGIPLFHTLITQKVISPDLLKTLVFELFHIPFRPLGDFSFHPKQKDRLFSILDPGLAGTARILPLVIKDSTLVLGLTDPEALPHVHGLAATLPHFRLKTVFIPFTDFLAHYKALFGSACPVPVLETSPETTPQPLPSLPGRSPDASLLLNFRTTLSWPRPDREAIQSLYRRYEVLRVLAGGRKRPGLLAEFTDYLFLALNHISTQTRCSGVEFYFRQDPLKGILILARPVI